jgi:hypothetical protein
MYVRVRLRPKASLGLKILMTSGTKKGTQIYFSFLSKVLAKESPPGSPTGSLWRGRPAYRAFCISLMSAPICAFATGYGVNCTSLLLLATWMCSFHHVPAHHAARLLLAHYHIHLLSVLHSHFSSLITLFGLLRPWRCRLCVPPKCQ